jgi:hypothetical protein
MGAARESLGRPRANSKGVLASPGHGSLPALSQSGGAAEAEFDIALDQLVQDVTSISSARASRSPPTHRPRGIPSRTTAQCWRHSTAEPGYTATVYKVSTD